MNDHNYNTNNILGKNLIMISLNSLNRFPILIVLILIFYPPLITNAQKKKIPETVVMNNLMYGKYGCTASKYRNGSYEFIPRGSFTISKNGKYTYFGFDKPSSGTFVADKQGNLLFKGGYFDGGKADKTDRPNKFLLVFPTIPDNRWTCSLIN